MSLIAFLIVGALTAFAAGGRVGRRAEVTASEGTP